MGTMLIRVRDEVERSAFRNLDVAYITMTRFSVPMPKTPGAVEIRASGAFEEWLAKRVELFRDYCLAPMVQQSIRPHAWLILFGKDVTPPVADLLEELREHDWIVPLILGDDWTARVADETRSVVRSRFEGQDFKFICCARLDSDDSLNVGFHAVIDAALAKLRRSGTPDPSVCINLPFGAMRHQDSLMVCLRENHFFAVVEPFETFRGPYRFNHTKVGQFFPVINVFTEQPVFIFQRHDLTTSVLQTEEFYRSFEQFADPHRVLGHFGLQALMDAPPSPAADPADNVRRFVRSGVGRARTVALPFVARMRAGFKPEGSERASKHDVSE